MYIYRIDDQGALSPPTRFKTRLLDIWSCIEVLCLPLMLLEDATTGQDDMYSAIVRLPQSAP